MLHFKSFEHRFINRASLINPLIEDDKKKEEGKPEDKKPDEKKSDDKTSPFQELLTAERKKSDDLATALALANTKNDETKKRLDEIEKKRLEEEGDYKGIAEKESKRAEEAVKESEKILKESNERIIITELKVKLTLEGVEDLDYHVFVDKSKLKMENGIVVGLDEAIKELKDKKPHIFKKETTLKGKNPPPPTDDKNQAPVDVRKLKPEEYKKHKENFMRDLRVAPRRAKA